MQMVCHIFETYFIYAEIVRPRYSLTQLAPYFMLSLRLASLLIVEG
jgi:hypothetical protein